MTGMTAEQEAAYELEETELGERASIWKTNYMLAMLYSKEHDRIFFTILMMIRSIQERTDGVIPAKWMPAFDDDGHWIPAFLTATSQPEPG